MNIVYKPKYRHHSVLAKMREQGIKNLNDDELTRVFRNTVGPLGCKRSVQRMISDGLTIEEVYQQRIYDEA